jgi:rRNA maturation endonuclease Nob1
MNNKNCACNKQIIWFFDLKPTIVACENCEITFCYDVKVCPYCGKKVSYFVKEEE